MAGRENQVRLLRICFSQSERRKRGNVHQIFYAWACEVEECQDMLLRLIKEIETNEFTRKKYTSDQAKTILQLNSLSLLLELYYIVANSTYRENTYEYLMGTASSLIDFGAETHILEQLAILDKAKMVDNFIGLARKLKESTKRPAAQLATNRMAYHLLIKGIPNATQADRIKSEFFPHAKKLHLCISKNFPEKKIVEALFRAIITLCHVILAGGFYIA